MLDSLLWLYGVFTVWQKIGVAAVVPKNLTRDFHLLLHFYAVFLHKNYIKEILDAAGNFFLGATRGWKPFHYIIWRNVKNLSLLFFRKCATNLALWWWKDELIRRSLRRHKIKVNFVEQNCYFSNKQQRIPCVIRQQHSSWKNNTAAATVTQQLQKWHDNGNSMTTLQCVCWSVSYFDSKTPKNLYFNIFNILDKIQM